MMQATEALKLVLSIGKSLAGKFYIYNALKGFAHLMIVDKNPLCPLCGKEPTIRSLHRKPEGGEGARIRTGGNAGDAPA